MYFQFLHTHLTPEVNSCSNCGWSPMSLIREWIRSAVNSSVVCSPALDSISPTILQLFDGRFFGLRTVLSDCIKLSVLRGWLKLTQTLTSSPLAQRCHGAFGDYSPDAVPRKAFFEKHRLVIKRNCRRRRGMIIQIDYLDAGDFHWSFIVVKWISPSAGRLIFRYIKDPFQAFASSAACSWKHRKAKV